MLRHMINSQDAAELKKIIDTCRNVVITTHSSPDGDAIGSSLAMYEYLKRKGKNVTVIVPNYFPDFLHWMKDADKIIMYERNKSLGISMINMADLIVCLDYNQLERMEDLATPVKRAHGKRLLIDHHLNPDRRAFDFIVSHPKASSTCELVYRAIGAMVDTDQLTLAAAEDLYAGMYTDTGGFSYNSNDPDVFLIVSKLLRKGIDKDLINRRINNNYSADRLKFIGYVLYEKLEVMPERHAALFSVTKEEMSRFHYMKGDMEGVVNMPLQIKGMQLVVSLREDTEQPVIRVSTRSVDDVACNELCARYFNGGGHKNAAGGKLECPMDEAVEIARRAIDEFMQGIENTK